MATPPPHQHHHQQLNHLLSDVPLEATPPRPTPTLQLLSTPSGHSTLSPFALSDAGIYMGDDTRDFILRQKSIWLQTTATHARAPMSPDDLSSDTNFPVDEDSEDDFKFNPCGESRFHRRQRNRTARQRAEKQAAQAHDDDTEGLVHQRQLTAAQRVMVEQKRNTRLKTMDRLKLNIRLGLLLRILELVIANYLGFRYSVESWIVYGTQMLLNSCSSCCLLWRFAGKYALPEDTVGTEMCKTLQSREKRCIMWQAIFKFLSATLTLSLAITGIRAATPGEDIEGYYAPAVTTLGISIVASACRGLLNSWGIWLMQEAKELQSILSDLLFAWLALWSSLQSVGVCAALIAYKRDVERQMEILRISDYVQVGWTAVCVILAVRDVVTYTKQPDPEEFVLGELNDKEC